MKNFFILLLLIPIYFSAQPNVDFELTFSGYSRPVDISNPEDGTDRLFIVEQEGKIKIIENETPLPGLFLDLSNEIDCCGEKGLLGLVFHPNYEDNGKFYINYIDNNRYTVVSEFKVKIDNANEADLTTENQLIRFYQPYSNHNGGDLSFGPTDGLLYIASGDGGDGGDPGCRAQKTDNFMGKILRMDVDGMLDSAPYSVPSNSPIELWSIGLRNPWRFSFDKETGDMWIADVGQGLWEEVTFIANAENASGLNLGWKRMEGNDCYAGGSSGCGTTSVPLCNSNDYTDPIYVMAHRSSQFDTDVNKANSITGGFVYRGCKYPDLIGKYICTDFVTNNSWIIESDGSGIAFKGAPANVTTYGEDSKGELWLATLGGDIYKVIDQNVAKSITLTSSDYPLSGTYLAADEIKISDPLNQNLTGVELIAPKVTLMNNVTIPSSSGLIIKEDLCSEN
ncbi:PQQ-dependent sugar dehydrogenase [Portibacter marinus]|uniref:PQQ-dependent sugar dehydrogenase n=1 Tax=Portibacter marinus TaxID=2898660 RepID=UPI001F1B05EF|nr:PQQ-dependent sugar dehydrogenase [Portibacter marinus]